MLGQSSFRKRSATLVLLVFGLLLCAAWAQTESVLYSFCAQTNCTDGANPVAGVVFDQEGNLYGTTHYGGISNLDSCPSNGCGLVFKLTPTGKETASHSFCNQNFCPDGELPLAALVIDHKGNLYGTTAGGGAYGSIFDGGVVFRLTPQSKERVLYNFCTRVYYGCLDGSWPVAGLIFDLKGNLQGRRSTAESQVAAVAALCSKSLQKGRRRCSTPSARRTAVLTGRIPWQGWPSTRTETCMGRPTAVGLTDSESYSNSLQKARRQSSTASVRGTTAPTGLTPQVHLDQKGNLYGTTDITGPTGTASYSSSLPKARR